MEEIGRPICFFQLRAKNVTNQYNTDDVSPDFHEKTGDTTESRFLQWKGMHHGW